MKKIMAMLKSGQLFTDAEASIKDKETYEMWIQTLEKGMNYETNIAG